MFQHCADEKLLSPVEKNGLDDWILVILCVNTTSDSLLHHEMKVRYMIIVIIA